jgi:uncharacterized membrane protein
MSARDKVTVIAGGTSSFALWGSGIGTLVAGPFGAAAGAGIGAAAGAVTGLLVAAFE